MPASIASIRRKQRQEELREKLQGTQYLIYLDEMDEKLRSGLVSKEELDIIKVRIDLNMKRLNKLLPDERHLEIEAEVGGGLEITQIERQIVKAKDSNG